MRSGPSSACAGAAGEPLRLAAGVVGRRRRRRRRARLAFTVDPTQWTAAPGVTSRLSAGVSASLRVAAGSAPTAGLEVFVGAPGAGIGAGRRAVYARIGSAGLEVFARPATGADIPLVPFAGLGSLAAAAEAALPFLLDKLAAGAGTGGPAGRQTSATRSRCAAAARSRSTAHGCAPGPPTRPRR